MRPHLVQVRARTQLPSRTSTGRRGGGVLRPTAQAHCGGRVYSATPCLSLRTGASRLQCEYSESFFSSSRDRSTVSPGPRSQTRTLVPAKIMSTVYFRRRRRHFQKFPVPFIAMVATKNLLQLPRCCVAQPLIPLPF